MSPAQAQEGAGLDAEGQGGVSVGAVDASGAFDALSVNR
jgi:hypothetical protein